MRRTLLTVLACAYASTCAHAEVVPGERDVQAFTLDNGLRIIVWPDHDIPNAVIYNWVRVGSRNERPGITGLAHFFEHMMFNGTSTHPPGDFDRIMEDAGGSNNAFTNDDVTVYQDWIPRTALPAVLDLEADRLAHLAFDPKVVESERGVVASERRLSVDDNNTSRLAEQVQATAYLAHPYGNPTLGWPSDIAGWQIDDLKTFFKTYYAPNNCTLVVSGDVDPGQVMRLMRAKFGSIDRQPAPAPIRTVEPVQEGERHLFLDADAQTPLLQVAYHSLAANDPEGPTLDLLLRILADGESSRLHRALVEEHKVAIEVEPYWHDGLDPGLTWFLLTLPAGGHTAAALAVLDEELGRFATEGPSEQELAKARNLALADFWRGLATIDGRARLLGEYEVFHGDYRQLFEAPAAYAAVTVEGMRKLAARIFTTRNRTVGELHAAAEQQEAGK